MLFSGGQDSTTALAWALTKWAHVETLGFAYGQRHSIELEQREPIRQSLRKMSTDFGLRLFDDHILRLDALGQLSETALTRETEISFTENGLPTTFVPARNLIFLTFAAALAYRRNLKHIVLGVCETDYSGYPDCRDDTIKAMQVALNLGLEQRFVLHTPLMWKDKAATFQMALEIGSKKLLDLVVEQTHSCYEGNRTSMHDWGYGCGRCPACHLRAQGWENYILNNMRNTHD